MVRKEALTVKMSRGPTQLSYSFESCHWHPNHKKTVSQQFGHHSFFGQQLFCYMCNGGLLCGLTLKGWFQLVKLHSEAQIIRHLQPYLLPPPYSLLSSPQLHHHLPHHLCDHIFHHLWIHAVPHLTSLATSSSISLSTTASETPSLPSSQRPYPSSPHPT